VSGKTGTAQVISLQGRERARGTDRDLRDHGWFVFMVPRDNPELAGVVFVEHGEHGYYGGTIARHIIDTYYAEKEGRPLPSIDALTPHPPPRTIPAAIASTETAQPAAPSPARGGPGR
jgi:penicillin-binding protein 2